MSSEMVGSGFYPIFILTLCLINAGLAQGKGQSGMTWFVRSLLLGPLATLLLVLSDRFSSLRG